MKYAIAAALLLIPAQVWAQQTGSICVAAVTTQMRESDHGDPTGRRPRILKYEFSIQIDSRERLVVPKDKPQRLVGFDLKKRHAVKIFDGADLIESFFFTFKNQGAENLCLFFTPFYQTWSLQPPDRRPWCKCK